MDVQWKEEERLAKTLEQRRMEGTSLQAEGMHKVPELVVRERMSQVEEVKGTKEKKKVKGWSSKEMNDRPSNSVEEDAEEMIEWRSFSQEAMDLCWKNLAEKMEEEVLDKKEVEECKGGANRGRGSMLEWRRVRRIKKFRKRMWRERIAGQESSPFSVSTTCSVCKA